MAEPTPEEILNLVRAELTRIHGKRYASLCLLEYARGWYYFSRPVQVSQNELAVNPIASPMRPEDMLKFLEELKSMPAKKKRFLGFN